MTFKNPFKKKPEKKAAPARTTPLAGSGPASPAYSPALDPAPYTYTPSPARSDDCGTSPSHHTSPSHNSGHTGSSHDYGSSSHSSHSYDSGSHSSSYDSGSSGSYDSGSSGCDSGGGF